MKRAPTIRFTCGHDVEVDERDPLDPFRCPKCRTIDGRAPLEALGVRTGSAQTMLALGMLYAGLERLKGEVEAMKPADRRQLAPRLTGCIDEIASVLEAFRNFIGAMKPDA